MAHYMLDVKIIGRSAGQSAVASAAYRAGEKLHDERYEKTHDYRNKKNIEGSEILAPENVPDWVHDRERLWNEVEKGEARKDAQLAREVMVTLPRELNTEQRHSLVKLFCKNEFVDKGMIADISWHNPKSGDGGENPHAHIMLTMRDVTPEGFGQKNREWNTAVFTKDDFIKDKSQLVGLRATWADYVNDALDDSGSTVRVSHLKNEEQGLPPSIDNTPSIAVHMHRRGVESDIYRASLHAKHDHQAHAQKARFSNPRTYKATKKTAYGVGYDVLQRQRKQKSGIEHPHIGLEPSHHIEQVHNYHRVNHDNGIDI